MITIQGESQGRFGAESGPRGGWIKVRVTARVAARVMARVVVIAGAEYAP